MGCKKILSLFAFLVLSICMMCFAQSSSTQLSIIIQPTKHIEGSTVSYTSSVYTIPSGKWAKAAELEIGETDGYLEVHLVKDGPTSWYKMPLHAGYRTAAVFDKIRSTGTTVTIAKVKIFIDEQ